MTESSVVKGIQGIFLASTWGEWAAIMLSRLWIFLFVPVLAWMWTRDGKDRHAVKEAVWSVLVSLLAGELVSLAVMRVRPFLADRDIIALISPPLNTAFPSLHTTIAAAITTTMYLWNKNAGHLCLLITFGVVVGRIAAGMHYPSDILAGAVIGCAGAVLVRLGHTAVRRLKKQQVETV